MKRTPLLSGIIYVFLGVIFTKFAIEHVQQGGWTFFTYLLVGLATFDLGSGLRIIRAHFLIKKKLKDK
jgi:hypothetical protein